MKRTILTIAMILGMAAGSGAQTVMDMSEGRKDCAAWMERNFSRGKLPPFSFKLDRTSSETFIRKWSFRKETPVPQGDGVTLHTYSWTDRKSGLQVEARVKTFEGFDAMEWTLWFRNNGSANSRQISEVKALDLSLTASRQGNWELFHARGSNAGKEDFMAETKVFGKGDSLVMSPYAGRSSSVAFPYFNAKTPEGGLIVAIGWSGTWKACITRPDSDGFHLETGLKEIDTYLKPGEEMRSPLTAILPWEGEDRMDGQNIFRRFVLAHHHPRDSKGNAIVPPICSSFNYGDPAPCNEYTCMTSEYAIALIHRYEQFNLLPEVFWLDAGWYEKADNWKEDWNWCNAVGNWKPDPKRFPMGMGPIGDAAHEVGCKFMVWFEPERVVKDSDWAYAHPEYMLQAGGGKVEPHTIERPYPDSYLIDMGNPEARKWMTGEIIKLLKENHIDYYRQDYNVDPEYFWTSNDEPGRKGMKEIRYICGVYDFWDELRSEFPDMLIDNCASGGRRLDLEAVSRSIALWRTDYNYGEPIGYQCHTYGLSQWLPASGTGVASSDPFIARSSFSSAAIFNWSVTSASSNLHEMHRRMAELQSVKDYYLEDFYPLTGYGDTTAMDIWIAYQLARPSDRSGRIFAFRRDECKDAQIVVKLRGLDPAKTYILENQDSFQRSEKTGKELADGLVLELGEPRTSLLLKYWEKE
ncbi:MAG: alpha-galactosidase [Bacteroidales bacterium]|nr:alpha-galactosidase [Bacteroidales bacterium]